MDNIAQYRGAKVVDLEGGKIGTVAEIYLDDNTGRPEWALVNTGLFGTRSTFIPLAQAEPVDQDLRVPYDKAQVNDAPNLDADEHLSPEEEEQLYSYYGLDYGSGLETSTGDEGMTAPTADQSMSVPTGGMDMNHPDMGGGVAGPRNDDAMTLSEEQVKVGTRQEEAGRVRLRKFITTDTVQQTVPVSREEVRLEREPITDANIGDAMSGPELSEEEHEVVLHEEVPMVQKEVVPTERISLDKEAVTEQQTVTEEVRKEDVEIEGEGNLRQ
jgi:uncharacterized protein (TIGR02271 family)